MSNNDYVKNSVVIASAACIATLCTQDPGVLFYIGLIGSALLVLTAIISPWLGLLALFPLAFALRPAPPSIGAQETAFAALLIVVFISALIKLLKAQGFKSTLRLFAVPLLTGVVFLGINFVIAMVNHVPLTDWIRGVVPFLFIYALIPVCALVGHEERNIHWLGASVGTLIFLTVGYIVLYYFYTGMWHPYWLLTVDGEQIKLSQADALNNLNAAGPMRDRITMVLAQATDAILPLGMVLGYVISILSRNRRVIIVSSLLSLLCVSAVLITFTRSMLISGLFTIVVFSFYVFFVHGQLRLKVMGSAIIHTVFGLAFIFAAGLDQIWLGRLSSLSEAAVKDKGKDFNVLSRVEEYKIAWEKFLSHPILGNGIGVKHEMRWETSTGTSFVESVGYIHNWPLYMLMVGGVLGFLIYCLIIGGPVLYKLRSINSEPNYLTVIRATAMTLAVYGLFFAVFRLISFNLLLAAVWGIILAQKGIKGNNPRG